MGEFSVFKGTAQTQVYPNISIDDIAITNLDAGSSGVVGTLDVFPATASKGKLAISCTNQTGNTTVGLVAGAMGQATTVTIPDPGITASYLLQSTAAVTVAEANVLDGATAGTVVASKAVVADTNKDVVAFRNIGMINDATLTLGTTTATAETKVTLEFDETTTGIGQINVGSIAVPQVLNTNPGATVIGETINIKHSAGAGDCDDLIASYKKIAVTGSGDSGTTIVGDAPRVYVGVTGGANNSVASAAYASQPWAKHEGTGAITAMSGLSALVDVNTDNFTANTVNAGHFHIEGAATVTGQFDGVMIEAYPDVTSLDSGLAIVADTGAAMSSGIRIVGAMTNAITVPNDAPIVLGTTTTTAETKVTLEFDETTSGVGLFAMGTSDNPQVLNTNPGATVKAESIALKHSAGAGDCDDLIASYKRIEVTGTGDSGLTIVGDAPRTYVGVTGGANNSVASAAYASQPWAKHGGTGAITAMSALSAKLDVGPDNFTANTVNAGHFHIDGAADVTGQYDGVMIEAYPDVDTMDSLLALAVDSGADVSAGIRMTGAPACEISLTSGAKIFTGSAADENAVYAAVGTKDATGSLYISTAGGLYIQVANNGADADWQKVTATHT